jgi:hypothetical protein
MRLLTALALGLVLVVPASAHAAESTDAAENPSAGLKGVELMLRPAFGGAPSGSPVRFQPDPGVTVSGDPGALLQGASPWGSGFVGQAMVGYRFLPLLSAGLRGGVRMASASSLNDGSSNLSRMGWDAGVYARVYPLALDASLSKHLDPWVSAGVTYMRDTQSFSRPIGNVAADISIDHHAVAIPLAIGIDYRVNRFLSLGPSFEYALASTVAGCVSTSASGFVGSTYCSNEEPGKHFVKADGYGVWSGGVDAKVTF